MPLTVYSNEFLKSYMFAGFTDAKYVKNVLQFSTFLRTKADSQQ